MTASMASPTITSLTAAQANQKQMLLWAGVFITLQILFGVLWMWRMATKGPRKLRFGKLPVIVKDPEVYHVVVMGSKSGTVAALVAGYYASLQQETDSKHRVCVVLQEDDRGSLAGHKPCSCPSVGVLKDMRLLDKLKAVDGQLKLPTRGGLVSPSGWRCELEEVDDDQSGEAYPTYAIERVLLEEHLKTAVEKAGCRVITCREILGAQRIGAGDAMTWEMTLRATISHPPTPLQIVKAKFLIESGPKFYGAKANTEPMNSLLKIGFDGAASKVSKAVPRSPVMPKAYGEAHIMIGPGAGHFDPFIGETDRLSMQVARYAGVYAVQMIDRGDISEHNVSVWDNNCWDDFAPPLHATWSAAILHRFPLLIDAYVSIGQARPDHLVTTAEIFTGVRPKYHLLWPTIAIPVLWEALLQMLCLSRPPQVAAGEKKGQ